ncbi:GTPase HflX [Candidatus Dependentiae bacterium]|nr:GTPase HflX [Candidatus Dependentiae bacterium]
MKRVETPTVQYPKTLLVGIDSPYNPIKNIESYYEEFENLVRSNGIPYDKIVYIKLRSVDPGYLVTKGKLEELIEICKEDEIREVIFSEPLSPQQERNLSESLQCKVFDRTQLILEIFDRGATSAEGKTQVELAMLQHKKTRLSGQGISMSQQGGRIGTRGPGETAKEKETQHIERSMHKLKRDLLQLAKHRETQRKQRLNSELPLICIIGYTNAGKSTILNSLTKSTVLAEDRLFATLDTTTRELFIDSKKKGLISDTVGFIQQLPHHLVEAFKSTLTELQHAHLLLQVVDVSDANWESHIRVVHQILEELEVDRPMLYVFNKADKIQLTDIQERALKQYQPHILVSAVTPGGLEPLVDFLRTWKPETNK